MDSHSPDDRVPGPRADSIGARRNPFLSKNGVFIVNNNTSAPDITRTFANLVTRGYAVSAVWDHFDGAPCKQSVEEREEQLARNRKITALSAEVQEINLGSCPSCETKANAMWSDIERLHREYEQIEKELSSRCTSFEKENQKNPSQHLLRCWRKTTP